MNVTKTYSLSIEPIDGKPSYQHPYHLGTIYGIARTVARDIFNPEKMRTVALIFDRRIVDVFDGEWNSDAIARMEE